MTFLGWSTASMAALGGVAATLVVALYMLRLRRRPIAVPFVGLWQRILHDSERSTFFARLKRFLSLLVQLTVVALLVLALGDPRRGVDPDKVRTYFVLVDESASMQSRDVQPNRIEVAKRRLREMVHGLGPRDRMAIAAVGRRATPLSTMTNDRGELLNAIDAIEARDTEGDLVRGLELASAALSGVPAATIVLLSDGGNELDEVDANRLDLGDVELQFEPIGVRDGNAAITGFSVRRYPLDMSRYEAMVELTNPSEGELEVELTLLGDGSVVAVSRAVLAPGETLRRFHEELAGAARRLEAELRISRGGRDWLPVDDHAFALVPERQRARVLLVSDGNNYLQAALLLDEYLDADLIAPGDYPPSGSYDVVIFDRVAPPRVPRTGAALYLDPPREGSPVRRGRRIEMFGFDRWDEDSALLRWMAIGDIQALEGTVLEPSKGDHVVAASAHGPLLVEGKTQDGMRYVVLGFDPRQSDWVLRTAWPLFVLNVIHRFVEQDTNYLVSYHTGELWEVPVPGGLSRVRVRGPEGQQRFVPVRDGRASFSGDRAGFYELFGDGPEPVVGMAANLVSPAESYIAPRREWRLGERKAKAVSGFDSKATGAPWVYLLLAAALIVAVEWITYHRRWTE